MASTLVTTAWRSREPILVDVLWGYSIGYIFLKSVLPEPVDLSTIFFGGSTLAALFAATLFSNRVFASIHYLYAKYLYKPKPFLRDIYRGITGKEMETEEAKRLLRTSFTSLSLSEHKARMGTIFYAILAIAIILNFDSLSKVVGVELGLIARFAPVLGFIVLIPLLGYEQFRVVPYKTEVISAYELAIERKRKREIPNLTGISELLARGAWIEAENWLRYELIPSKLPVLAKRAAQVTPTEYIIILDKQELIRLGILPEDESAIGGDPDLLEIQLLGDEIRILKRRRESSEDSI